MVPVWFEVIPLALSTCQPAGPARRRTGPSRVAANPTVGTGAYTTPDPWPTEAGGADVYERQWSQTSVV
jgi:hypothetical protein